MNKLVKIGKIRDKLHRRVPTLGSWMQIPSSSVAEIMGASGYDWVAIDLEHGAISTHQLPDLFRAIELGGTLPLVRLADGSAQNCKAALDAGAGGVIIPMVESASQLERTRSNCCWPPSGTRGVAFSRANLFGKRFELYKNESQKPLLVGMIESREGIENLDEILKSKCFDAIMIGPYDLSASLGLTGKLDNRKVIDSIKKIKLICKNNRTPCGIHIVEPDPIALSKSIKDGHLFIAYAGDSMFLNAFTKNPYKKK